jgi:hypothetical protein
MGFHHATGQSVATWASFADGKIVLRSRDPREGFIARVNKVGNTVYEQRHEAFTGRLQNIRMTDNDYGSQFCFNFADGDDTYIITDRMDGSYARAVISYLASDAFDPAASVGVAPRARRQAQRGAAVPRDGDGQSQWQDDARRYAHHRTLV